MNCCAFDTDAARTRAAILVVGLTDDEAFDLAIYVGLVFEEEDRELFGPLIDAKLVWLDEDACAPIAESIVDSLWDDEFRADLEGALAAGAEQISFVRGLHRAASADLRRFARAVVEHAAVEFAMDEQRPVHCLACVEEGIAAAGSVPARRRLALSVARIATRAASVPHDEVRAAVAAGGAVAQALATDERRLAVRSWLRSLADLGLSSMPGLSEALREVIGGPLPPIRSDEVWAEAVVGLIDALPSDASRTFAM